MHQLARPHHFAGFRLHRHGGGDIGHLLQTVAAIIVRAGRGRRQEGKARFRIDRDAGPDIGGAGLVFLVLGNDVEGPLQRAGAGIDAIDGAGILDLPLPVIAGPAHDQRVFIDGGRLDQAHLPFVVGVVEAIDIDDAVLAEAGTGLAGVGIHAVQLALHGADIDHLLAGLAGRGHRRRPIGDAAILQALVFQTAGAAGVIAPLLRAGVGLDREDLVARRADIHRVVHEQRRGAPGGGMGARTDIAGVEFPRLLQVLHIVGGDLGGGRIFLRLLVAAKGIPHTAVIARHHHVLGGGAERRQVKRGGGGGNAGGQGQFHLSLHLRPHPSQRCGRRRRRSRSSASRAGTAPGRP